MTSEEPPSPSPERPAGVRADADGAADIAETQVERTELAWARTSLASAGLGALAVHLAFDDLGLVLGLAIGALVATPGLVAAWWRIRGLRTSAVPQAPRHEGVAILAGTVALVGTVTLALILS
jgi:uncharacterized membrane protein YidH (DUF202 family)